MMLRKCGESIALMFLVAGSSLAQPPGIMLNPGERYVPGSLRDQYGNPVPDYIPPPNIGGGSPSSFPVPEDRGGVQDGTGLELGVTIYEVSGRVIVSRTRPGTPAAGLLFPNDQLVRAAYRDAFSRQVYRMGIRTVGDVATLKASAGPGARVALEVYRPTTGYRSFFVNFAISGEVTQNSAAAQAGDGQVVTRGGNQPRAAAASIVPDSTGEAAQMLGGRSAPQGGNEPQEIVPNPVGGDSAADLLNGPGF
jgi:hypothetical protein